MKSFKTILMLTLICALSCESEKKSHLKIYQFPVFKQGQRYELIIDDGEYALSKEFDSDFTSDKFSLLKEYHTNLDSIKVYFRLDKLDTTFTLPANYTTRLVVGSDVFGGIVIGTDKERSFWIYP